MVKVLCKQKHPLHPDKWTVVQIYLDGYIKPNLDIGIAQLHKDFDQIWFIDGAEGAGKSALAATCAYYTNKPETRHTLINRICLDVESFEKAINNAEKYESLVLDEAFGGMAATGAMSKVNKLLQKRFTEIRAKNLFIFIVAPSFMDIQRYFAIWRSKCLLHVYLGKNNKRGFCAFYSSRKKIKLFMLGKKQFYNYKVVSPNFVFSFLDQRKRFMDMDAYNKKKFQVIDSKQTPVLTESQMKYQFLLELQERAKTKTNIHPAVTTALAEMLNKTEEALTKGIKRSEKLIKNIDFS